MLRWYPPLLLQVILEITLVPIAITSIFALNAIVDRSTPWSIGILNGPGMSPDFGMVLTALAFGWIVVFLGWRGAKTVFKWMLIVWHLGLTVGSILLVTGAGEFAIQGEAIGFRMSFEILGPFLTVTTLVIAVFWLNHDLRFGTKTRSVSPFQRRNEIAGLLAFAGLVASGIAFFFDYEQIGTIVGTLAMVSLHEAIRPVNPSKELHEALVTEGSAPR